MIRTAGPDDATAIAQVHVASWRAIYRNQMPNELLDSLDVENRVKRWSAIIASHPGETLVAEKDNRIVGFVNFGPDRDAPTSSMGEIRAIYLLEEYWRKGLGSRMLDTTINELQLHSFASVMIWVLQSNNNAINFYQKHGLQKDGLTKTETIDGFELNAVRMSKPIDQ